MCCVLIACVHAFADECFVCAFVSTCVFACMLVCALVWKVCLHEGVSIVFARVYIYIDVHLHVFTIVLLFYVF